MEEVQSTNKSKIDAYSCIFEAAMVYRPVRDYEERYEINRYGDVRSTQGLYSGKFISHKKNKAGYIYVKLYKGKSEKSFLLHRLVAVAFLPNPENKPVINHIDNNKENNDLDNLQWCTQAENVDWTVRQGRNRGPSSEKCHLSKLKPSDILEIRELGESKSTKEIAKIFGVSVGNIRHIIERKTWKSI